MEEKLPHLWDVSVDVATEFESSHCKINVTGINSKEACLWAILFDTDGNCQSMLSVRSFWLKDFLDKAFYDVDDGLSLFANWVEFPLKGAHCLLDLNTDHLVELLVFFFRSFWRWLLQWTISVRCGGDHSIGWLQISVLRFFVVQDCRNLVDVSLIVVKVVGLWYTKLRLERLLKHVHNLLCQETAVSFKWLSLLTKTHH